MSNNISFQYKVLCLVSACLSTLVCAELADDMAAVEQQAGLQVSIEAAATSKQNTGKVEKLALELNEQVQQKNPALSSKDETKLNKRATAKSLTLAEPVKIQELEGSSLATPLVESTESLAKAKPASLKAVVSEEAFKSSEEMQIVDHAAEDTEQDNGVRPEDALELLCRINTFDHKVKLNIVDDKTAKLEKLLSSESTKTDKLVLQPANDFPVAAPAVETLSKDEIRPSPLVLLNTEIPAATATRLAWKPDQSFKGISVPTPVLVVNGAKPGPTVCLTAATHGDELNGIEIVRRVLYNLDPEELSGAVIGVPIVNLQGFHRNSRYLSDRRDLNRFFPGNPSGSSASRLAYSFFNEIISYCDALVDLHTGSFYRTNLPQLRADTNLPAVLTLAKQFGSTVIVHSAGAPGTLRWAAVKAGIPAVTLEAGESMRLQEAAVKHGVKGIETLLEQKDMLSSLKFWKSTEAIYKQSLWIRADQGGILFTKVKQGDRVKPGDVLGVVTDPITNQSSEILAPFKGRVIGLALNQVVMPGFATFHLGVEAANLVKSETAKELIETVPAASMETIREDFPEMEEVN